MQRGETPKICTGSISCSELSCGSQRKISRKGPAGCSEERREREKQEGEQSKETQVKRKCCYRVTKWHSEYFCSYQCGGQMYNLVEQWTFCCLQNPFPILFVIVAANVSGFHTTLYLHSDFYSIFLFSFIF